ncbi:MAG: hypothetical protein NVSMB57_07520 [Actinomycetota bacterium]
MTTDMLVSGVFGNPRDADDAIQELREKVHVEAHTRKATPGSYHFMDPTFGEGVRLIGKGIAIGSPVGAAIFVAGMALASPITPGLGLAGWMLALWAGGGFGAVIGSSAHLIRNIPLDDAHHLCQIAPGGNDVVVICRPGRRANQVRGIMERHDVHGFMERMERGDD